MPISGFDGDNLVKRSTYMPWYTGLTLVEALDALQQPKKPIHKPLRFTISERYKIGGIGTVVMGRVQTGILKVGMNICFAPRYNSSSCYSIEKHYETVNEAIPGDIVGINAKGLNSRYTKRGSIAGDPKNDPPMNTESFIAYVIIMNHPGEIKAGYTPVIHVHTAHIACTFEELLAKADRKSGKKIENQPKFLKVGDAGFVKLVPTKPLCIENFSSYAPLGRFVIRDNGKIIGVGVVQEVKRI